MDPSPSGTPGAPAEAKLSPGRVITAVLGFPALTLFLLRAPRGAFLALALPVAALALREVHALAGSAVGFRRGLAIVLSLGVCASAESGRPGVLLAALAAMCLALGLAALVGRGGLHEALHWVAGSTAATLYVALPLGLLILLRRERAGVAAVAVIVLGTWARDVGAFLVGRATSGPPLRADLNPRKHVLGAAGGLLLAAAAVAGIHRLAQGTLRPQDLAALAVLIGVFGQAGDLFESMLKRQASARHSGRLLADQGGALDSIDGLLFTAPAAYLYLRVVPYVTG
jgi:phosphatidate cytidylyltransferase